MCLAAILQQIIFNKKNMKEKKGQFLAKHKDRLGADGHPVLNTFPDADESYYTANGWVRVTWGYTAESAEIEINDPNADVAPSAEIEINDPNADVAPSADAEELLPKAKKIKV